MTDEYYDLIIIGGGAAGMTAGIYAARYNLKTIIISKEIGGVANEAHIVDNWPGMRLSGYDLMQKFKDHVLEFNIPIVDDEVKDLKKDGDTFTVSANGKVYQGKSLLLAMGTKRRKLNVPGEVEFAGRGVSYCATCDSFFYKDKTVGIIGGSDSAVRAASLLANVAKEVIVLYRGQELRAEPATIDEFNSFNKGKVITEVNVTEIYGDQTVKGVKLDNGQNIELDGVFIEIGSIPTLSLAAEVGVEADDKGYIKVDPGMATNVPGVYAAGDLTDGSNKFRQIVTAAAEGSIAIGSIYSYLRKIKTAK